ncbi:MAG: CapA family protein [Anaerolineae bacterium]|nr:CapA family protein [Anaerolineae bacterium]
MKHTEAISRRPFWLLMIAAVALGLAALVACSSPQTFDVTATPTRTPQPSATPTPTITPSPTPTPTPAWPVSAGCDETVPAEACAAFQERVAQDPEHFVWSEATADVQLGAADAPNAVPAGTWVYALAAPFYTIDDGVSLADLQAMWAGTPSGPFAAHPLLMTPSTHAVLTTLWGAPAGESVQTVDAANLLSTAIERDAWAILPFDALEPRWKVLQIDGVSPMWRGLDTATYPLTAPLFIGAANRTDAIPLLYTADAPYTNRDESKMAVVVMTGVTALTRGTGRVMDVRGMTFPAQDIGPWLREADLTHISNEVSFTPDCPEVLPEGTMVFCSREPYIELLDAVGTDIVELTGNHNNDYGIEPNLHTFDLFRARGWRWFGGGENLVDATTPLTVTIGPNRLAFLGCNDVGPEYGLATEDRPGAAPCDWEAMAAQVAQLRADGWLPIFTVQAYETYEYFPTDVQVRTFRTVAEAGAVIVQGSQAHQAQGFAFEGETFVHYGLGNLFFDQMWSLGTRQEFIDRHVFYDGRYLGVELLTALLEDYARPRPTTPEERREMLETTFAVSGW